MCISIAFIFRINSCIFFYITYFIFLLPLILTSCISALTTLNGNLPVKKTATIEVTVGANATAAGTVSRPTIPTGYKCIEAVASGTTGLLICSAGITGNYVSCHNVSSSAKTETITVTYTYMKDAQS